MPAGAPPAAPSRGMQPLEPRQPDGTGLACGFFEFRSGLDGLLADALPDYLLLRASGARYAAARRVPADPGRDRRSGRLAAGAGTADGPAHLLHAAPSGGARSASARPAGAGARPGHGRAAAGHPGRAGAALEPAGHGRPAAHVQGHLPPPFHAAQRHHARPAAAGTAHARRPQAAGTRRGHPGSRRARGLPVAGGLQPRLPARRGHGALGLPQRQAGAV